MKYELYSGGEFVAGNDVGPYCGGSSAGYMPDGTRTFHSNTTEETVMWGPNVLAVFSEGTEEASAKPAYEVSLMQGNELIKTFDCVEAPQAIVADQLNVINITANKDWHKVGYLIALSTDTVMTVEKLPTESE